MMMMMMNCERSKLVKEVNF